MVRCLRGRKERFAKPSYALKAYRGFESRPHRNHSPVDRYPRVFYFDYATRYGIYDGLKNQAGYIIDHGFETD